MTSAAAILRMCQSGEGWNNNTALWSCHVLMFMNMATAPPRATAGCWLKPLTGGGCFHNILGEEIEGNIVHAVAVKDVDTVRKAI